MTPDENAQPRDLRYDQTGQPWCAEHKVMAVFHRVRLANECPFCWFLKGRGKDHACTDARCFCHVVRAAVADGSAPWMTAEGREQYRRAFE